MCRWGTASTLLLLLLLSLLRSSAEDLGRRAADARVNRRRTRRLATEGKFEEVESYARSSSTYICSRRGIMLIII